MKLKLYEIDKEYIKYLQKFDKNVLNGENIGYKHSRKYVGILIEARGIKYFAPLSSPKKSDYTSSGMIRKSIPTIIRIICPDKTGKIELKGTIKISNMIPVLDMSVVREYNIKVEENQNYKIKILKEYEFINNNAEKIIKNANVVLNQKLQGYDIGYIRNTVDFRLLEEKAREYRR